MNLNRRKFLGVIRASSIVSTIVVGQANAQSPKLPQTVLSNSVTPANRELTGKVAHVKSRSSQVLGTVQEHYS